MSEQIRPKMKPMPFPRAEISETSAADAAEFPQQEMGMSGQPVLPQGVVPAGAVLAEWRPRFHGRAGAAAAQQMLDALESQRPHLTDQEHLYDGCTKLIGSD